MTDFFIVILTLLALIVSPFLTVFMLNTLFGLGLSYTVKVLVAALILNGMVTVNVKKN